MKKVILFKPDYPATLGDFLEVLSVTLGKYKVLVRHPHSPEHFTDTTTISKPHSYRGYYDRLAFVPITGDFTVVEAYKMASEADGKIYRGYKGGDFKMNKATIIHIAYQGFSGFLISSFEVNDENKSITLIGIYED